MSGETTTNPPLPVVDLENCSCLERAFFAIGVETGKQIREMLQLQIANHQSSIDNLRQVITTLNGPLIDPASLCNPQPTPTPPSE
jgi:hypothetical protein